MALAPLLPLILGAQAQLGNNQPYSVQIEPARMLAQVLREDLGLMGTKVACGMAKCGACTVLLDGVPVYSCITLAIDCAGRAITTIEGLAQAATYTHCSAPLSRRMPFNAAFAPRGKSCRSPASSPIIPIPVITRSGRRSQATCAAVAPT